MVKNIAVRLKQEMKSLPENWIVVLETSAKKSMQTGIEAVKILTGQNLTGIILSASRPHANLFQLYEKNRIDVSQTFILCCVCNDPSASQKIKNVVHLPSVSALTEISIALSKATKKFKGKSFLFLDSISSLLIHNNPKTLAKFIHSVLVLMRLNEIKGILIAIEDDANREFRAELIQLCDKVIKV